MSEMRVLAVDHDVGCLRLLNRLLMINEYEVSMTNESKKALELVRDKRNKYNLIIMEIEMPDMDGFKLLELINLETDIPVIVMSSNSDPELIAKTIASGALFHIAKPSLHIGMLFKSLCLNAITKHKLDKKKNNGNSCSEERDRLRTDNQERVEIHNSRRKPRFVWTVQVHDKFVEKVNELGGAHKAKPKQILEAMKNVENLERQHISSHLQKYRLKIEAEQATMNQSNDGSEIVSSNINSSPVNEDGVLEYSPQKPMDMRTFHCNAGNNMLLLSHQQVESIINSEFSHQFSSCTVPVPRNEFEIQLDSNPESVRILDELYEQTRNPTTTNGLLSDYKYDYGLRDENEDEDFLNNIWNQSSD